MPWHGDHGWESHLRGLETRWNNGNLTNAGYAKALLGFAARYEQRAAAWPGRRAVPHFRRALDLAAAKRLRDQAASLQAPSAEYL